MSAPRTTIVPLPASLIALRKELAKPKNNDAFNAGMRGRNFQECLAFVAAHLGIVLDGYYDVPQLCDVLYEALSKRNHLIARVDPRLVQLDAPVIGEHKKDPTLILPEGVDREQLEADINSTTKSLSFSDRVSDGEFAVLDERDSSTPGACETKSDSLSDSAGGCENRDSETVKGDD